MDLANKYNLQPLPLEKELRLRLVKSSIPTWSREQLEESLAETLNLVVRLTHQTQQLMRIIESIEGKLE